MLRREREQARRIALELNGRDPEDAREEPSKDLTFDGELLLDVEVDAEGRVIRSSRTRRVTIMEGGRVLDARETVTTVERRLLPAPE
ncbi:MAG: hypothetical protein AAF909_06770 [Pseudomonadota bacterium]